MIIGGFIIFLILGAYLESMCGMSTEAALEVSFLSCLVVFLFNIWCSVYMQMPEKHGLVNVLVSLIKEKKASRIKVYPDKLVMDDGEEIKLVKYGFVKKLSDSEILDCVCKANILLARKYIIEEVGHYYGPIDTGNYETEFIQPLYGKPYSITRRIIYEGGFVREGYALAINKENKKDSIQDNWDKKNWKDKCCVIVLPIAILMLILLIVVVSTNDSHNTNAADAEVRDEEVILETSSPVEDENLEVVEVKTVENNTIMGHLERRKKDWYEYVAPVSGEYIFSLGLSNEDCLYKLTIYTHDDEKVKTISSEYDGISKVNLEEGKTYKFYIRQIVAVNLSDAPFDYTVNISF